MQKVTSPYSNGEREFPKLTRIISHIWFRLAIVHTTLTYVVREMCLKSFNYREREGKKFNETLLFIRSFGNNIESDSSSPGTVFTYHCPFL